MAWIELHQGLGQHHKVRRLKRTLGIGLAQVIGHMALLWTWALDAAPDGDLTAFDAIDIAEQAEWDGDALAFVAALVSAGLLDQTEDERLVIHDWMEYAGRLVEKRKTDAERKRMSRGRPADVQRTALVTVPNLTVPNLTQHDQDPPQPPKGGGVVASGEPEAEPAPEPLPFEDGPIREPGDGDDIPEAKSPALVQVPATLPRAARPAPKPRDAYTADFEAFWAAYPGPRRIDKADAFRRWKGILGRGVAVADLMAGLQAWRISADWRKDDGAYICAPSVWLNKQRWEDAPAPAVTQKVVPMAEAAGPAPDPVAKYAW